MKRLLDILLVLLMVPFWVPLFIIVWILVRFTLGKPVFFRQERAGLEGKPFTIIKFRSMREDRDTAGNLLPDAQRLSPFGKFLRSLSLDELPEIWLVLAGRMSLVGPRPLPTAYTARYSAEQARRLDVLPGITGWAQVNGRNATTWEERFQLDVWYVDNRSFWLDLKILVRTLVTVLRREGISHQDSATMHEFMG